MLSKKKDKGNTYIRERKEHEASHEWKSASVLADEEVECRSTHNGIRYNGRVY